VNVGADAGRYGRQTPTPTFIRPAPAILLIITGLKTVAFAGHEWEIDGSKRDGVIIWYLAPQGEAGEGWESLALPRKKCYNANYLSDLPEKLPEKLIDNNVITCY